MGQGNGGVGRDGEGRELEKTLLVSRGAGGQRRGWQGGMESGGER